MIFLVIGLAFSLIGAIIGQRKGATLAGFLYGFFFGPIGCLIVALLRGNAKMCPKCGERVRPDAQVCRYCQADLSRVWTSEGNLTVGSVFGRIFLYFLLPIAALIGFLYFNQWKQDRDLQQAREVAASKATSTLKSTATPNATPTPKSSAPPSAAFLADVGLSQKIALAKYPQLGVKGSPFNVKFLARLEEWKARGDQRLSRSDWPEKLAVDCAEHP